MQKSVRRLFLLFILINNYMAIGAETLSFCQGEMPPYIFSSQGSDQAKGIWPNVMQTVFEDNENIQVESIVLPWKRCQIEVLKGNYDGAFMFTHTEERQRNYILLPSIHTLRIPYYYSKKHYPKGFSWDDYSDLGNKIIGLQRGNNYYQDFHQAWQTYQFSAQYALNIEANLLKLVRGRIDLAWDSDRVVQFYLKKLNLENEIIQATGLHTVHEAKQYIGLSKKGKAIKYKNFIVDRLNKMKESGKLDEIINADYSKF